MSPRPVADLLATLNEPTRLRVLNTISRVPLSVRAALDAVDRDPAAQRDRAAARQRSRARLGTRARPALMDAT